MDSGVAFKSFTHFEEIFWCVVVRVFSFHSFAYVCSVFPATFIEEAVFFPLYIFASFVKNKVLIGAWVYFWAFYLAPLVYTTVFVPVSYSLDDYSFVV